ncbi:MAG: hypothetical protein IKC87_04760 [Clostridia bacterium]|nr:hypothetical protein [Clostridia bacterium]
MKRICTSILLIATVAILCLSVFVSCAPTEADYRFGVGTYETELGQVAAAVVIDENYRIKAIRIDEIDLSKGKTESKKAQGASYGMFSAWGSQLDEWDDQVEYLEIFLIGKTLGEVTQVTGKETDLTAGCTIAINGLTAAAAKAVEDAIDNEIFTTAEKINLSLTYTVTVENDMYVSLAQAKATAGETAVGEVTLRSGFPKAAE